MSETHGTPDSVGARYAVTLGAQLFRLVLSFTLAALVPRALGPAIYGNYAFLMSTSTTLRGFTDSSTQQAMFTFSAQERESGPLAKLYGLVLAAQFLFVLVLLGGLTLFGRADLVWHGQQLDQILLVTVLEWSLFLATSLQQLGDSKGRTVRLQLIAAASSLLIVVGLVCLWLLGRLDFYTFVAVNLCGTLVTCALLAHWLFVRNRALFWSGALQVRSHALRWWRFARPLLLLQYYLPLVPFVAIYLLQRWYGSTEQAYYALALQWSAFALVFTTAGVWIFWREIANRNAAGDTARVAQIYTQFSALFMFLVLVLACWLSASSGQLVDLVAGDAFRPAGPVLALLAWYPVSQTIGQLTTASLKATERTLAFARWSLLLSFPDLALTWLVLAPASAPVPGLALGAVGLAGKVALFGLVSVHVFDWVNCRLLGVDFLRNLRRRLTVMLIVGALAWLVLAAGAFVLLVAGLPKIAVLAISSAVYFAMLALALWFWPSLAGLEREKLVEGLRWIVQRAPKFLRRGKA